MISESSKRLSEKCKLSRIVDFTNYNNHNNLRRLNIANTTIGRVVEARYTVDSRNDFIESLLKILNCKYFWLNDSIIKSIQSAEWR